MRWALHDVLIKKDVGLAKATQMAHDVLHKKVKPVVSKHEFRFRHLPKTKFSSFRSKPEGDMTLVFGELKPEFAHLEGKGILDYFKKGIDAIVTPVKEFFSPNLSSYNNATNRALVEWGTRPIERLVIHRKPVEEVLSTVLNTVSFGKWEQARRKYGFDKFFHLSLVATVKEVGEVCIEKLDRVSVSKNIPRGSDVEMLEVSLEGKVFSLMEMMEKARKEVGDKTFFEYDSFKNNCQYFISYLLKAEGLYKEREKEFVFQDISKLVQELPSHVSHFQRGVTDIAATWNKISGGHYEPVLKDNEFIVPYSYSDSWRYGFGKYDKEAGENEADDAYYYEKGLYVISHPEQFDLNELDRHIISRFHATRHNEAKNAKNFERVARLGRDAKFRQGSHEEYERRHPLRRSMAGHPHVIHEEPEAGREVTVPLALEQHLDRMQPANPNRVRVHFMRPNHIFVPGHGVERELHDEKYESPGNNPGQSELNLDAAEISPRQREDYRRRYGRGAEPEQLALHTPPLHGAGAEPEQHALHTPPLMGEGQSQSYLQPGAPQNRYEMLLGCYVYTYPTHFNFDDDPRTRRAMDKIEYYTEIKQGEHDDYHFNKIVDYVRSLQRQSITRQRVNWLANHTEWKPSAANLKRHFFAFLRNKNVDIPEYALRQPEPRAPPPPELDILDTPGAFGRWDIHNSPRLRAYPSSESQPGRPPVEQPGEDEKKEEEEEPVEPVEQEDAAAVPGAWRREFQRGQGFRFGVKRDYSDYLK
jgi:hypothetical protein